jgi:hypothetical protein
VCIVQERRPAGFLDMKCQTCFFGNPFLHVFSFFKKADLYAFLISYNKLVRPIQAYMRHIRQIYMNVHRCIYIRNRKTSPQGDPPFK